MRTVHIHGLLTAERKQDRYLLKKIRIVVDMCSSHRVEGQLYCVLILVAFISLFLGITREKLTVRTPWLLSQGDDKRESVLKATFPDN